MADDLKSILLPTEGEKELVRFIDLKQGDIYLDKVGRIYMKIATYDYNEVNSVNISTAEGFFEDSEELVRLLIKKETLGTLGEAITKFRNSFD